MSSNFQKKDFGTDTAKILEILTHRLYNEKDVFLKELISNSSDACNQVLFAISSGKYQGENYKPKILINCDSNANTIAIIDNGIGMSDEDMHNYLGTIASSNTRKTLENLEKSDLIGQFGIGFYSSFIVAEEVQVWSKKYGSDKSFLWTSDGKNAYEIKEESQSFFPREDGHGTQIILKLRKEDNNFTNKYNINQIIRKYSNYIKIPIFFLDEEDKEPINEGIIPWREKNISKETAENIYKNMLNGNGDIYFYIHQNIEGAYDYSRLLFIPASSFYIPITRDQKPVIHLYVNGVFICNDGEFLPLYLRFIRGIVEARDLPININRETIRNNPFISKMKKSAQNKILEELIKKANDDRENYVKNFWEIYGMILKEGIIEDYENKNMVMDACLFRSAKTQNYITLKEYLASLPEDTPENFPIYYFLNKGETVHPLVDTFMEKNNCDVLMLKDELEKLCFDHAMNYQGKNFLSIMDKEKDYIIEEEDKSLLGKFQEILKSQVKIVEGTGDLPNNRLGFFVKENNFMNFSSGEIPSIKMSINIHHPLFIKGKTASEDQLSQIIKGIYCLLKLQESAPADYYDMVEQQINLFQNSLD